MRYSLSDYKLSIKLPSSLAEKFGIDSGVINVGGEGSYLESMNVNVNGTLWTTEAMPNGDYIHTKNLDRSGTVSVTLSMISDISDKFRKICSIYYTISSSESSLSDIEEGLTLTLQNGDNNIITCESCYLTGIPRHNFQASAQTLTWDFTCGKVVFND